MSIQDEILARLSVKPIETIEELESRLSEPTPRLVESLKDLDGDILILGVGGKVGPTIARLAMRAVEASGVKREIIGVDFSQTRQSAGSLTL